jgi:hypothetical protein
LILNKCLKIRNISVVPLIKKAVKEVANYMIVNVEIHNFSLIRKLNLVVDISNNLVLILVDYQVVPQLVDNVKHTLKENVVVDLYVNHMPHGHIWVNVLSQECNNNKISSQEQIIIMVSLSLKLKRRKKK